MENNAISEYIKKLNQDYLNVYQSDEYKMGIIIYDLKEKIKHGDLWGIGKQIKRKNISRKIRKFSTKKEMPIKSYVGESRGRIAVYMAVFGSYDEPLEPMVEDPNCDYYLISDKPSKETSIWKNPDLDLDKLISNLDNLQKNRYCKLHPQELFPQYDYTIYLDGNIEAVGYISELVTYINEKTGIALHNMSNRDCIYDEELACKLLNKGNPVKIHNQLKRYKDEGFPTHFGMYECPIIIRNKSSVCCEIMDTWWKEFIEGARRDQISLPYVIWSKGLKFDDIGFIGNDVRKNPYFRVHEHLQ